jgi:hypothetical protein
MIGKSRKNDRFGVLLKRKEGEKGNGKELNFGPK